LISGKITIKPIGVVQSELSHRYETPRQGVLAGNNLSVIKLNPKNNFQQALKYLDGFDRIWVIYQFHLNTNWKPLISPPRHTRKKVGVFASRAPYRPNQMGMSCVKLEKVEGLNIYITESDMLDGSPVIDIKPYLPYSDSFPDAATGWVKNDYENKYDVVLDQKAELKCNWLKDNADINLINFSRLQLEFSPTDTSRKRVSVDSENNSFILAYRTWRINYSVSEVEKKVFINQIQSGYSKAELKLTDEDKYNDKVLHIAFIKKFML
jgi:tRNA-Thr(GGU) m(6)t(6)A37 methyltransferase TsaA